MLQLNGQPVQQRHDELVRLLGQLGLKDRLLFAEPVVTWPSEGKVGKIAWYADTEREPVELATLGGEAYERSAERLRQVFTVITGRALQAKEAALLRAACVMARLEAVLVDGERIVLSEWGVICVPWSNQFVPELPELAGTPLAPFLPAPVPAVAADPADPPPPAAPSPGVKEAYPDPMPAPEITPKIAALPAAAAAQATEPALPMASPLPHSYPAPQQPELGGRTRELLWHAATALVFLLLGLAAGLRLMAPARLAVLLGMGGS